MVYRKNFSDDFDFLTLILYLPKRRLHAGAACEYVSGGNIWLEIFHMENE